MKEKQNKCNDERCPVHGSLSVRGRHFKGIVKKIIGRRAVIEFERSIFFKKYERYAKEKTRLHAYIPPCISDKVKVGEMTEIGECRPISKIMKFVVINNEEKTK